MLEIYHAGTPAMTLNLETDFVRFIASVNNGRPFTPVGPPRTATATVGARVEWKEGAVRQIRLVHGGRAKYQSSIDELEVVKDA